MAHPRRKNRSPVRYELRAGEKKKIAEIAKARRGLTHDEIMGLARQFGTASKPIHQTLTEIGLPVRPDTRPGPPAKVSSSQPGSTRVVALRGDLDQRSGQTPEVAPAKRSGARTGEIGRLRKALEAAERAAKAAEDRSAAAVAQAKAQMASTAALRRATAEERAEVDTLTHTLRAREEKIAELQAEIVLIGDRLCASVPYLDKSQLEPLMMAAYLEHKRREAGGRKRRL